MAIFGLGLVLLGLAIGDIRGGRWVLVSLACCCFIISVTWSTSTFFHTKLRAGRSRRVERELEQARCQLSDLAVDLLGELNDYAEAGYMLASDLSARLQRELPDVERELTALEECDLAGHLEALVGEQLAPVYFQRNPPAKWWLKEDRARRGLLLEQPGLTPGPRSRPSALAG
jgi:hypothetical protein